MSTPDSMKEPCRNCSRYRGRISILERQLREAKPKPLECPGYRELERQLAEERARLDYVISSGAYISWDRDGENCNLVWHCNPQDEEDDEPVRQDKIFHDGRAAIDAARKGK